MSDAMRYIMVPKPETVLDQQINTQTGEARQLGEKLYSYFDLLDDNVWALAQWRKDETHMNAWNRLVEAHEQAKKTAAAYIPCTAEDFAIFKPFATLQDVRLSGPNVKKIVRLTQCVVFAASKKPEEPKDEVKANGTATASETSPS